MIGLDASNAIGISAKTGLGVPEEDAVNRLFACTRAPMFSPAPMVADDGKSLANKPYRENDCASRSMRRARRSPVASLTVASSVMYGTRVPAVSPV